MILKFELVGLLGWSSDDFVDDIVGSSFNDLHEVVDVLVGYGINGE